MLAILLHLDFQSVQQFYNVFEIMYLGCCLNTTNHYCGAAILLKCTRIDLFVVEYSFKWKLQFITNHNRDATTQYCIKQPSWGWGVPGWTQAKNRPIIPQYQHLNFKKDGYFYEDRDVISTSISNFTSQIQWILNHKGGLNWILNKRWIQKIAALH